MVTKYKQRYLTYITKDKLKMKNDRKKQRRPLYNEGHYTINLLRRYNIVNIYVPNIGATKYIVKINRAKRKNKYQYNNSCGL